MSLESTIKKGWMWLVGGAVAMGGVVWAVGIWVGGAATTVGGGGGATAVVAAFVLSFADKGWVDQLQKPATEIFALADDRRSKEMTQALDEVEERISALSRSIESGGTDAATEADDPEQAAARAALASAAWSFVRETAAYQISGDRVGWVGHISEALRNDPEPGDTMKHGLELVATRLSEEDLLALVRAELPLEAQGRVVDTIVSQCQVPGAASMPEDARLLEETLLEVYETPGGALAVTAYVNTQDALGKSEAADVVLTKILDLTPDSATGAAAAKALMMRRVAQDPELVIRLYRRCHGTVAGDVLQPMCLQALAQQRRVHEAVLELAFDAWKKGHNDPATIKGLAHRCSQLVGVSNVSNGISENINKTKETAGEICVSLAERGLIRGEFAFASVLLLEVLKEVQAQPINLATGKPLDDAALLGGLSKDAEARSVAKYLLGLIHARFDRRQAAQAILTEVVEDPAASAITRAHALVALAERMKVDGDFDGALSTIVAASEALPNSLTLQQIQRAYEILCERPRLEQEIDTVYALAENASTTAEAVSYYKKIVELYLSVEFREQAVGVLVQASKDSPAAPELLRHAIQILQDSRLGDFQTRIRVLEQRLKHASQASVIR